MISVFEYINVISKLIGEEFVDQPKCVQINVNGKENFMNFLTENRPQERQKAHGNSFDIDFGLLNNDAAFLQNDIAAYTYSIELKPKQGWHLKELPFEIQNLLGYEDSLSDKCRFCAMQYLKVHFHSFSDQNKNF